MAEAPPDAARIATEARDRVRFEEDALALSDQVFRVARHLSGRAKRPRISCRRRTRARSAAGAPFTPGTNLRAWLLRILTNLNIDRGRRISAHRRRRRSRRTTTTSTTSSPSPTAPPTDEERVVERLSQDDIVYALSAVPHDFRDVIVLVDIGDFSYQDAAQILDIPIGTVMSRLHRGRRILKRELAESVLEDDTT